MRAVQHSEAGPVPDRAAPVLANEPQAQMKRTVKIISESVIPDGRRGKARRAATG